MELKPISREGIPAALHKAERYRLLNDSSAAESICLDILEVESDNQHAVVTRWYEKAEAMRPAGNDESILRWNSCARLLGRHEPRRMTQDEFEPVLGE